MRYLHVANPVTRMALLNIHRSVHPILSRLSFWSACVVLLQSANCRQPAATASTSTEKLPYNLEEPALVISLINEELKEISGLSPTDVPGVYCAIADERGEIFFIDAEKNGVVSRRVLFRDKGDFEGVEMVGNTVYALKSNGAIFAVENWKNEGSLKMEEYRTGLSPENDFEGLCYDPKRHSLLLAAKGNPENDAMRNIYAFNLKTKQIEPNPVYSLNPRDVNTLIAYGSDEKQHFFSPSGIAIHPKTKELYIISTALKRLVVLNPENGAIRTAARLDKGILPQPEGIAFDAQGNLYLSSEGKKHEGLLAKFNYKP